MIKYRYLFLLLFFGHLTIYAQHDLQAKFIRNSTETAIYLDATSEMFTGDILNTRITMNQLNNEQDGEVSSMLMAFSGTTDCRICLLKNDNNRYCIRLTNTGAFIEVLQDKVSGTDFNFEVGDQFRVIRCQDKILYYQNSRLIHVTQMALTEKLFGVIQAESADNLDMRIQFIPQ